MGKTLWGQESGGLQSHEVKQVSDPFNSETTINKRFYSQEPRKLEASPQGSDLRAKPSQLHKHASPQHWPPVNIQLLSQIGLGTLGGGTIC